MMEIALNISNKLFFDSEIGMNIYEKDEKSGKFTVEAGKMKLCEYSRPPAGKNKYALRMEESTSLPPGKEYEACLTVSLDAPGGPYTLETDVRTRFIPQDASMTLTTSKMVGSKIRLGIASKYVSSTGDERFKVWIDLNNNGKEDENENVTPDYSFVEYTIQSQAITIHGPVSDFTCSDNQIISLDISRNAGLGSLSCGDNLLTSLDVSNNTSLETLWCTGNVLTSLEVSNNKMLTALGCNNNRLTKLDVNGATALTSLTYHEDLLTTLDASSNVSLPSLSCSFNQLVSLVVSDQGVIKTVNCESDRLRGTSITELIESLPDRTGMNYGSVDFGLSFEGGVPGENYYTGSDKEEARKKHWLFY